MLKFGDCLLEQSLFREGVPEIVVGLGKSWSETNRNPILLDGFVKTAGIGERDAQVVAGIGEIRGQVQRAMTEREGWFKLSPPPQGIGEIGENIRIDAAEVESGLKGCGRFVKPVELVEGQP